MGESKYFLPKREEEENLGEDIGTRGECEKCKRRSGNEGEPS